MSTTEYEKTKEGNLKDLHEKLREVLEDACVDGNFTSLVCRRIVSRESTSRGRGGGRRGRGDRIVVPRRWSARA
jgi:hypothetical protein